MPYYTLNDHFGGCELRLNNGNVLAVYTDEGPTGMCGQSMSVTCPHTTILWFKTYDDFLAYFEKHEMRHGKKSQLRYCVIGEYGVPGTFTLIKQDNDK